jgi:hypothetical protein
MQHGPIAKLNSQDAITLLHVADGDVAADDLAEPNVTRLETLGLVEQRGVALGLTSIGIHEVARLRLGSS